MFSVESTTTFPQLDMLHHSSITLITIWKTSLITTRYCNNTINCHQRIGELKSMNWSAKLTFDYRWNEDEFPLEISHHQWRRLVNTLQDEYHIVRNWTIKLTIWAGIRMTAIERQGPLKRWIWCASHLINAEEWTVTGESIQTPDRYRSCKSSSGGVGVVGGPGSHASMLAHESWLSTRTG